LDDREAQSQICKVTLDNVADFLEGRDTNELTKTAERKEVPVGKDQPPKVILSVSMENLLKVKL
jgi:hypothetical protein